MFYFRIVNKTKMGRYFIDQYSLLHFATGVIAYFFAVRLPVWILLHTLFELIENTSIGMALINEIKIWPGGKPFPDKLLNSVGDTVFAVLGWIVASYADKYSRKHHLYWK